MSTQLIQLTYCFGVGLNFKYVDHIAYCKSITWYVQSDYIFYEIFTLLLLL